MPQTRAHAKTSNNGSTDAEKANTKDTTSKKVPAKKVPTKAAVKAAEKAVKAAEKAAKAAEKAATKAASESAQVKRLSQIAAVKNKNAAAHANDATPGGPYSNTTPKKDQPKRKARKPAAVVESSDAEPLTDVEGTVKQKAKKGGSAFRGAVQALRQQKLDLTRVDETNEESGDEVDKIEATEPAEDTQGTAFQLYYQCRMADVLL